MTLLSVGRLAPSPTGAQHIGNARTYLIAWLITRSLEHNQLLLRIEDLETPRVKLWAVEQIYDDLGWLGLDWDASPRQPLADGPLLVQSARYARYREVLAQLIVNDLVYPCTCSRSEIDLAAAPHESTLDGSIYPGTCRHRGSKDATLLRTQGTRFSWRFRWDSSHMDFVDRLQGRQQINPKLSLGDFVVWRNDDQPAYQLAVVIDDLDAAVDHVVRGSDLIYSTFRQNALYEALQWKHPEYFHVPLVVGSDGRRLAKRHGDTRLSTLRMAGITARQLVGFLAYQSGLSETLRSLSPRELLGCDLHKLDTDPMTFEMDRDLKILQSIRN